MKPHRGDSAGGRANGETTVCLNFYSISGLHRKHPRVFSEELRQQALVIRQRVLDDHECCIAVGGHCREEDFERSQGACRSAQPNHRDVG